MINTDVLLGLSEEHLTDWNEDFKIHSEAYSPLTSLKETLKNSQHELKVISAFRSFETQQIIWNNKSLGKRVLLDPTGQPMDYDSLSSEQIVKAILKWSALPGLSRHHWGTDIDIFDENLRPENYSVELTPAEVNDEGIFGPFHQSIDKLILENNSNDFFRPYSKDLGGVSPERWHISYAPTATPYLEALTLKCFKDLLNSEVYKNLEFLDIVKKEAEQIHQNYCLNINPPQLP